jgi:hexosaminidase
MTTMQQGVKWMMIAGIVGLMFVQTGFSQESPEAQPARTVGLDKLFRKDKPVVPQRGVHMYLAGLPPAADRFVQLLKLFAAARYNVVVVEWDDSFPWTVDPRFRSPTAYTPEDIRRFQETAAALGLELIPQVQCLGHMETALGVPGYEHLREVSNTSSGLNPLDPKARELVQAMVDDVLKLMPGVKHFHLGGDEARTLGQNPDTKAYVNEHGKGALYLQHVEPILDRLNARHIRPILWHDMMIDWDSKQLQALAAKCDLMVWGYMGNPNTTTGNFSTKVIQRFRDHGIVQWGATAYKGCEGDTRERHTSDRPVLAERIENAMAWAEVAQRQELAGVVATGWSRWSVDTLQCVPIDAALDALVAVGVILHDGELPVGGVQACVDALDELGEKQRFEACRKAMERLTEVRREGWLKVQQVREQLALCKLDPRRTSARNPAQGLKGLQHLTGIVRKSQRVADEVRRSLDGRVPPVWIEEYVSTRLTPLQDELDALTAQAGALTMDSPNRANKQTP